MATQSSIVIVVNDDGGVEFSPGRELKVLDSTLETHKQHVHQHWRPDLTTRSVTELILARLHPK
jgi:hypothetical protein